jgi:hypothetical protein
MKRSFRKKIRPQRIKQMILRIIKKSHLLDNQNCLTGGISNYESKRKG